MAKVEYGAIVTGLTGSVGGWTFSRNASGSIVRGRGSNRKLPTVLQAPQRTNLNDLAVGWSGLLLSQQQSWNTFAANNTFQNKAGQNKSLTGFQVYIRLNNNLTVMGGTPLVLPPARITPIAATVVSLNIRPSGMEVGITGGFDTVNSRVFLYATPVIKRSSLSFNGQLRFMGSYTLPGSLLIDFTTDWENVFNQSWPVNGVSESTRIGVLAVAVDLLTGQQSAGSYFIDSFIPANEGISFWSINGTFVVGG